MSVERKYRGDTMKNPDYVYRKESRLCLWRGSTGVKL